MTGQPLPVQKLLSARSLALLALACLACGAPGPGAVSTLDSAGLAPIGPAVPPPPAPTEGGVVELIGRWHMVRGGESVSLLAGRFGVPIEDLIELNGLVDPSRIEVGQRLFIYGVEEIIRRSRQPAAAPKQPASNAATTTTAPTSQPKTEGSGLDWPVRSGRLSSPYGPRWGRMHRGIDIAGSVGTPILAAAAGEVIYSDHQPKGYGNLVILQHAGELITVYAHNRRNVVDVGQRVRQGAKIAELGNTGNSTGPHLHFEVRVGRDARDPLKFLPKRE